MKSWRGVLLAGVGVALLVAAGAAGYFGWQRWRGPQQPLYAGKPMEHWLERLRSADAEEWAADRHALQGQGGLAVLLEARQDADLRAHRRAVMALADRGADASGPLVESLPRGGARV